MDFAEIELELERGGAGSGIGFKERERNVDMKYRKLYEETISPFTQVLDFHVVSVLREFR